MLLRVTQYGEEVLRQKGEQVTVFDDALIELANDMLETMYESEGIGLAAQQVGHAIQLCVIDIAGMDPKLLRFELDGKRPPLDLIMPMALVNPEVSTLPGKTVSEEEGCLSFPGVRGEVARADKIEVRYQDPTGAAHLLIAEGWFARVVQHEVDHLNGVLFIDHMESRQLKALESKIKKVRRSAKR
jgi:peptide deformylase